MKKARINDEPPKSKSPLDQTTSPSRQNPFPDMENPRHQHPLFLYSQTRPPMPTRQILEPVRMPRQVGPLQGTTCQRLAGHATAHQDVSGGLQQTRRRTPGHVRIWTGDISRTPPQPEHTSGKTDTCTCGHWGGST